VSLLFIICVCMAVAIVTLARKSSMVQGLIPVARPQSNHKRDDEGEEVELNVM